MPTDKIMAWPDYAEDRNPAFALPKSALTSYRAYLTHLYQQNFGEAIPPIPDVMPSTPVHVNVGRWVWQCQACRAAVPVQQGEPLICYQCGNGGWMMPAFPINQESIEEELLRQPGRRLFAPIRNWRPGWEVAYLQGRTQRANEAIAAGNPFPRSLSIGATRVWAGGEVLTASNKNTFESDVMDDLGGRNGRTDQEDAMRIKTGTLATTQPYLDLTQDYVGFPHRTSDPTSGEGRLTYRSDIRQFRANNGQGWYSFSQYADLLGNGQDMTQGAEITVNLPTGETFSSYRWMQLVLGAFDDNVSDTLLVPVSLIPSGPFNSILYMADATADRLYTVDVATGIATALPNGLGTNGPSGLASHGGILYMVDAAAERLYTVDVTTGIATALPNALGTDFPAALASHGGILYMADATADRLYTVDVTTGIATALPNALGTSSPSGLASHGGILYMVDGDTDTLYTVDVTTGIATALPNALGTDGPRGLASHGGILYMADATADRLYTVDVATGIATALPNALGTDFPAALASHGADDGFNVNPWLLIARNSATQVRILPLRAGHLHDLIGIT